jgi:hypothetical protein
MPTIARPSPPSPGAPDANHSTALPTIARPSPPRSARCQPRSAIGTPTASDKPQNGIVCCVADHAATSISPTLPNFDIADVDSAELRLA